MKPINIGRVLRLVLCMGLLCLSLCGCVQRGKGQVVLGLNLELSGRLSQYGTECLQGARLAHKELGGEAGEFPLKLAVADNRSENGDSILGFLRLTQTQGAVCVIGPTTSSGVKAELQQQSPVPIIVPTATSNSLDAEEYQNRYRICFTDQIQGSSMGKCAWALGYRKAVIFADLSSDYSAGTSASFRESFEALGGTVVGNLSYTAGDTDFSVLLTQLEALEPQAVFLPGYDAEAALIIRQAREMGLSCAFLSGDTFDSPVMETLAGTPEEPLSHVYFTNHYDPRGKSLRDFAERFEKEYGTFPSAYASLGYDSVMLFADALERAGEPDPEKIAQALGETKGFQGVTGEITFDERCNAVKEPVINAIVKGRRTVLRLH